jgi:hypothetical protein
MRGGVNFDIPWEARSLSRYAVARDIPHNMPISSHATSKFTRLLEATKDPDEEKKQSIRFEQKEKEISNEKETSCFLKTSNPFLWFCQN